MSSSRRTALQGGPRPVATRPIRWRLVAAVEATAAAVAVALDLWVPTLVLLAMTAASLLVRRDGLGTLGLHRRVGGGLVVKMLGFAAAWSLFQLGVVLPVAGHLSGSEQDLAGFEGLHGNVGMLLGLLVLSWTLAAFGEELGYRGYLLTRLRETVGPSRVGLVVAVLGSSVVFGLAHAEQGVVGITVVTLDGVAWSVLRIHYRTLWASVLAHGFNNTLGFVAFFLVGPVHPFW